MRYNTETDMVEIYYNGIWKEWKRAGMKTLYLYYYTNENTDVTGGWTSSSYVYSGSTATKTAPTKSISENCMKISIGSASSKRYAGSVFTGNAIDLTKFNTLKLKTNSVTNIGTNGSIWLYLTTTKKDGYSGTIVDIETDGEIEFDISDLSGQYYIVFALNAADGTTTSFCVESVEIS